MSDLEIYLGGLVDLSDAELKREADSAKELLKIAKASESERAIRNLHMMQDAIRVERGLRQRKKNPMRKRRRNPAVGPMELYRERIQAMDDAALKAERDKMKKWLKETKDPDRKFGTEGHPMIKEWISITEAEISSRSEAENPIPNPCWNPTYRKPVPYRVLRKDLKKAGWTVRPGRGSHEVWVSPAGTTVSIPKKSRGSQMIGQPYLRQIRLAEAGEMRFKGQALTESQASNPEDKPRKVRSLASFKNLPVGTLVTVRDRTGYVVTHHRVGKGLYAAPTEWFERSRKAGDDPLASGARYFFEEDLEEYFRSGKENPEKKAKKKKKRMGKAGRAGVGAGVGALALGPIGAIGGAYLGSRYRADEDPGNNNPRRRRGTPPAEKDVLRETYEFGEIAPAPGYEQVIAGLVQKGHLKQSTVEPGAYEITSAGLKALPKENGASTYLVHVKGVFYSPETGEVKVQKIIRLEANSHDEARKKAQSRMSEQASRIGYEFGGKHKDFKSEKQNPRRRNARIPVQRGRVKIPAATSDFKFLDKEPVMTLDPLDRFVQFPERVYAYAYKKDPSYRVGLVGLELALKMGFGEDYKWTGKTPPSWIAIVEVGLSDARLGMVGASTPKSAFDKSKKLIDEHRRAKKSKVSVIEPRIGFGPGWAPGSNPQKKKAKKKTKKKAKKKAKKKEGLVAKSRRLWDEYYERPTKKALRAMFDHLEEMEKSTGVTIRKEWRRAKRSARAEARRLGMKV